MTVPAYAGLPGLYRSDPVELAAQRFGGGSLQTARVAAVRILGSDHTSSFVYLLRRDEELLRSADPVRTLSDWLPAEPDLR